MAGSFLLRRIESKRIDLQQAAEPWGYGPGDFPNAEQLAREVLCLPIHPFLSTSDVDRVIESLRQLAD